MEAVVGLLLMLLGVSRGVQTHCDGRQNGAQCYGALGGTVVLRLMDNASEIFRYQWIHQTKEIFNGRKNQIVSNKIANRSSFTPSDGTFRINNLSRADGGQYTLVSFDSNGQKSEPQTLQLTIQAPVSSVLLDSECLSQGEMRVSCSSGGGDSPQYNWTLDGHTLTDAQLLSGHNEAEEITLRQNVSGLLVCSVRNNISSDSSEKRISTCGFIFINCTLSNGTHISQWVLEANNTLCITTTTTTPTPAPTKNTEDYLKIMAGVLSALVILLVVGVAVVWTHKKKQNSKAKEEDNEEELTYADVRIVQQQKRQMQQRSEMEVEYGQVRFSGQPRQNAEPTGENCVYAMVRRDR